jgi:hypothetical protein
LLPQLGPGKGLVLHPRIVAPHPEENRISGAIEAEAIGILEVPQQGHGDPVGETVPVVVERNLEDEGGEAEDIAGIFFQDEGRRRLGRPDEGDAFLLRRSGPGDEDQRDALTDTPQSRRHS